MSLQSAVAEAKVEKKELEDELVALEKQIFDLETRYLNQPTKVTTGFGNFNRTVTQKQVGPLDDSERLFSLSSSTSPLGAIPWPSHVLSRKQACLTSVPATGTVTKIASTTK
jgi:Histone acetyltransferase subunit NuA4